MYGRSILPKWPHCSLGPCTKSLSKPWPHITTNIYMKGIMHLAKEMHCTNGYSFTKCIKNNLGKRRASGLKLGHSRWKELQIPYMKSHSNVMIEKLRHTRVAAADIRWSSSSLKFATWIVVWSGLKELLKCWRNQKQGMAKAFAFCQNRTVCRIFPLLEVQVVCSLWQGYHDSPHGNPTVERRLGENAKLDLRPQARLLQMNWVLLSFK